MPARRSRGYEQARARLIAVRYVRDDRPRVRVRIDPIVHRSMLALAFALPLVILAGCNAPPKPNTDPRRGEVTLTQAYSYREWVICIGPDLVTHYDGTMSSWQYDNRNDPRCKP